MGGWSPISAIKAAVDHAWIKSVLPNWEAIAAFLEQISLMSEPDTLEEEGGRRGAREEGRGGAREGGKGRSE